MSSLLKIEQMINSISGVVKGQEQSIKKIISVFFAGGHVLLDDMPGTGKTTIAKAIAKSLGLSYSRVQFTPDLMPSDILGVTIYNQKNNSFEFHEGPVFTNILLADEINRSSPRTQAALLEAMGERQVTIDRTTYKLKNNFFVIATENPNEFHGTYPLPEAQLDRFYMRFSLGYIEKNDEIAVLKMLERGNNFLDIPSLLNEEDVENIRNEIENVFVSEEIYSFIVDMVRVTRECSDIRIGSSLRTAIAMLKISKSMAYLSARNYVIPEDVLDILNDCLAHKIVLTDDCKYSGKTETQVINELLGTVKIPQ